MRILFLLTTNPSGVAGHHYSARDLGLTLREYGHEVDFVYFTRGPDETSKALDPYQPLALPFSLWSPADRKAIRKRLLDADACFCFDELSVRILLYCCPELTARTTPIKPGWIDSAAWTASTRDFICFSRENFDFYTKHPKYRSVALHHIPQRVRPIQPRPERMEEIRQRFAVPAGSRLLVILGRIDPYKFPIFKQGIRLAEHLRAGGQQVRAVIVGSISSQSALKTLSGWVEGKDIDLFTEPLFTQGFPEVIACADYIVANGRTIMEAMSSGAICFVPGADENELPQLIREDNFEAYSYANFTHRVALEPQQLAENAPRIADLAGAAEKVEAFRETTRRLYRERLDCHAAMPGYLQIAEESSRQPRRMAWSAFLRAGLRLMLIDAKKRLKRRKAPQAQTAAAA